MKSISTIILTVLSLIGCDYIPRTVYEIETVNGKVIKLSCPVIDTGRSEITYLIDGDCVIFKD